MKNNEKNKFVKNPGKIASLFQDIINKKKSPVELLNIFLLRIEEVQEHVEPWVCLAVEDAKRVAQIREQQIMNNTIIGPLHGIPVGIKDIIDVKNMPTKFNSKAFEFNAPSQKDAEIILALKSAGAIILGKTHTTEFAFLDPSPAKNPHNINYTPGGSSSGSAAAVACGSIPLSIGTQTMASVNRPASYCGISAFKPSNGSVNGFGISPLAPSFDTIGFYGWSLSDAIYGYNSILPNKLKSINYVYNIDNFNIVFIEDDLLDDMIPEMNGMIQLVLSQMKNSGYCVKKLKSPFSMKKLGDIQRNIMIYEAGGSLVHLLDYPADKIGTKLRSAILEGQNMEEEFYISERLKLNQYRNKFFQYFNKNDIFIWPAAPGAAPKGLSSTGDPKYIAPWTALSGPIITSNINCFSNENLPLGFILSSYPGNDNYLSIFANNLDFLN